MNLDKICIHEAGHFFVAFSMGAIITKVEILESESIGYVSHDPLLIDDENEKILAEAKIRIAGRRCEQVIFGNIDNFSADDQFHFKLKVSTLKKNTGREYKDIYSDIEKEIDKLLLDNKSTISFIANHFKEKKSLDIKEINALIKSIA